MPRASRRRWIEICAQAAVQAGERIRTDEIASYSGVSLPKSLGDTPWARSHLEWLVEAIQALINNHADALDLYRPLPGECERFHASTAGIRLLTGSNQAGKSLAASAEFARIARGKDPYRKRASKDLRCQVVAYDERAFADILWQKLGLPGAFQIVPDENTGMWRSVRPNPNDLTELDPIDVARQSLWRPAPPLLPPNEIEHLAWKSASRGVPDRIILTNGTLVTCHTSRSNPQQGVELDYAWYDEEIDRPTWLPETTSRLVKRDGIFVWSATPQNATEQLLELHRRRLAGDPDIEEFKLLTGNNPYLSKAGRQKMYERLKALGPDELRVRWFGEYAAESRKVYPQFNPVLGANLVTSFRPPLEWMRFLVVDPGTTFSGALFLAVPPDGSELHAYDEVVLRNATAVMLAREVKKKVDRGGFETFVIDKRAGRATPMGYEDRVVDHYAKAFEEVGLRSRRTGHSFEFGSDDVESRTEILRALFAEDEFGRRRLKVHESTCSVLAQQIENRRVSKTNLSKRERADRPDKLTLRCELLDCLEYGAAWIVQESGGLDVPFAWVRPEVEDIVLSPENPVYLDYQETVRKYSANRFGPISLG